MEGFNALLSLVTLVIAILVLVGFYNLCHQVTQIRDDHHALRVMIEEELKRSARDRYASAHPAPP